jgi:hypothetical protein
LEKGVEDLKGTISEVPAAAATALQQVEGSVGGVVKIIESQLTPEILATPFQSAVVEIDKALEETKKSVGGVVEVISTEFTPEMMATPFQSAVVEIDKVATSVTTVGTAINESFATVKTGVLETTTAITNTNAVLLGLPATVAAVFGPVIEQIRASLLLMPPMLDTTTATILSTLNSFANNTRLIFSGVVSGISASFRALESTIRILIESLKEELKALEAAIASAKAEAAKASANVPGKARGGPIYGPGSSTSDSILARLSKGEYVIRASAVRKYGMGVLHALNSMMMPKTMVPSFAAGGPVSIPVDVLPQFVDGGLFDMMGKTSAKPTRVVNLTVGEETFKGMIAPEEVAQKLVRFARRREVRSGGRKPGWYGQGAK